MATVLGAPAAGADEPALVEGFRRGDEEAFGRIVAEHRRTVYRVAWQLLGNHEDADEAAQLTFLRAWQARRRFRGEASLRTWLVRIALNVACSIRSRQRAVAMPGGRLEERECPAIESAERQLERRELARQVREAVERLAPRQREAVLLKVFSDMTCREVAAAMRLTEGAVKAHLHQAVSSLRRRLGPRPAREEGR